VSALLQRLADDRAVMRYRGDFDWPGIAIANRIVSDFGAKPWRMGAADYEAALVAAGESMIELPRLTGDSVAAAWDGELAPAMSRAGWAVHEELMLEDLLSDLLLMICS
jgi:uncharacterized protein (TIGR02679 family)